MLLIGLLLIAAVLVVIGVILSSVGFVVASLVASALAAAVMLYSYITSRRAAAPASAGSADSAAATESTAPPGASGDDVPAAEPLAAAPAAPTAAAATAAATAAAPTASDAVDVLVVDGQPLFHAVGCSTLSAADESEPIPLSQALEDGFEPCPVCRPTTAASEAPQAVAPVAEPAPVVAATTAVDEVWVVDGRPDFHVAGCSLLQGDAAGGAGEAIPRAQALEDGFAPCAVCRPDVPGGAAPESTAELPSAPTLTFAAVGEPAPDAAPAGAGQDEPQVWVVDGYPEYHVEGCSELAGLPAETVPYEQALDDGFQPCVVCDPDRQPVSVAAAGASGTSGAGASAGSPATVPAANDDGVHDERTTDDDHAKVGTMAATEVWVVDGFPDYHRSDCPRLEGTDSEAIPHDQAVEDGFAECTVCRPEAAEAPEYPQPEDSTADTSDGAAEDAHADARDEAAGSTPETTSEPEPEAEAPAEAPAAASALDSTRGLAEVPSTPIVDVWVVDGFPDYHRGDCPRLTGMDSEPIPHDQAVEDGFAECTVCRPEAAEAPEYPQPEPLATSEPAAEPSQDSTGTAETAETSPAAAGTGAPADDVWVVDGFPDYHRSDCPRLAGTDSEPIPHDQAVEDGFAECTVCRPEAA
ncbi:hypothetical protein, partial [Jatrophihabitans endophyticus]|uniref:hypothetical protein n=1 Tax=Jatrophihabitans endophyticus TaxID=1206085 RepID=UPI0019E12C26